ncbi:hypothetical protein AB0M88_22690, partial [Actinoplanes sp. NPDC051411]
SSGGQYFGSPNPSGLTPGGLTPGAPAFAQPTSAAPASAGPRTPAPTRPFAGAIVPAPHPPTQPVTQYPIRPATIEVTQRNSLASPWVITIAAVLLVGAGVAAAIVVPQLVSDHNGGGTPSPTIANGSSAPAPAPSSADPADGGLIVATAPDLNDGRADEVIAMLDVYFNSINSKDYPAVASVLDPDGTTDPGNASDMAELADGTRSTTDSHVTLTSLDDTDEGLAAEVTFQSNQKAGDGPEDRPDETCTQWDIIYTLSHDKAYRILKSDATSQPC